MFGFVRKDLKWFTDMCLILLILIDYRQNINYDLNIVNLIYEYIGHLKTIAEDDECDKPQNN